MNNMFDFDRDGHTDFGEQFVGYQIFENCTKGSGESRLQFGTGGRKLDGFDIFAIIVVVYAALNTICGWLY